MKGGDVFTVRKIMNVSDHDMDHGYCSRYYGLWKAMPGRGIDFDEGVARNFGTKRDLRD